MKRLKDTEIKYKIQISVIQKHIKEGACHSNIPYKICVDIDKGYVKTSTAFKYTKKGKNELIKFIREECHIQ